MSVPEAQNSIAGIHLNEELLDQIGIRRQLPREKDFTQIAPQLVDLNVREEGPMRRSELVKTTRRGNIVNQPSVEGSTPGIAIRRRLVSCGDVRILHQLLTGESQRAARNAGHNELVLLIRKARGGRCSG